MEITYKNENNPKLIYSLLKECYGTLLSTNLEDIQRIVQSPNFNPRHIIIAYIKEKPVGMIRIAPLPEGGKYELVDLAVYKEYWKHNIQLKLIKEALKHLEAVDTYYVRGYTLSIDPYVSAYLESGFKPVRRILRLEWNLENELPRLPINQDAEIINATEEDAEVLVDVFLNGLLPYWDWWISDQGGWEILRARVKPWFRPSPGVTWIGVKYDDRIVGLTGFYAKEGAARFFGVIVLPKYRLKGIGYTLLHAALKKARENGLKKMTVYTVAYLERLAPGAVLYLKSGATIHSEYIQLEKWI